MNQVWWFRYRPKKVGLLFKLYFDKPFLILLDLYLDKDLYIKSCLWHFSKSWRQYNRKKYIIIIVVQNGGIYYKIFPYKAKVNYKTKKL